MSERPLRQDTVVDEPGLVGARWWQETVVDPVSRRHAIVTLFSVGAGVGIVGLLAMGIEECQSTTEARRSTLELQRNYGWSFGAATEPLVFQRAVHEAVRVVSPCADGVRLHAPCRRAPAVLRVYPIRVSDRAPDGVVAARTVVHSVS